MTGGGSSSAQRIVKVVSVPESDGSRTHTSDSPVVSHVSISWGRIVSPSAATKERSAPSAAQRTNPEFYELTRFAFEGFFSLAEKGEWEVASNEMLKNMIVYPDEFKTWMIGDGYFLNQRYDPNYIGDATEGGFYMGTDIG